MLKVSCFYLIVLQLSLFILARTVSGTRESRFLQEYQEASLSTTETILD